MIHTSYTVGITTAEYKALQSVTTDQKLWLENAIQNRARIAIENIQQWLFQQYNLCVS